MEVIFLEDVKGKGKKARRRMYLKDTLVTTFFRTI